MRYVFDLQMKNNLERPLILTNESERCNYVPIPYGVGNYRYYEISWDESDLEAGEPSALEAIGFKTLEEYKKKEKELWQSYEKE